MSGNAAPKTHVLSNVIWSSRWKAVRRPAKVLLTFSLEMAGSATGTLQLTKLLMTTLVAPYVKSECQRQDQVPKTKNSIGQHHCCGSRYRSQNTYCVL